MTNTNELDELKKQICDVFGIFPEELEYNLPGGIGTEKMNKLMVVIQAEIARKVREARLDELNRAEAEWINSSGNSYAMYLDARWRRLSNNKREVIDE